MSESGETQLRMASSRDAATVLRFIRELAEYEREPDAVEVTEARLREQLGESPAPFECLIAEIEQEAVGFALFFHTYSTWRGRRGIHLEDLYVTPAARTRGVGRSLLARIAAIAVERDCARLEWAVLDWNELAMTFYRGLGAGPMAGWDVWRIDREALKALSGC